MDKPEPKTTLIYWKARKVDLREIREDTTMHPYYENQENQNAQFVGCAAFATVIILAFVVLCFAIRGYYCFQVHT